MSNLKEFKKKNLTIDDLRTYIPEKGHYRYDPQVMVAAVNPETEEVITTEEYKNSPKKAFAARNQKKGFKLYNQYGQETRDLLPDGGILPESAAAKIEEHKQREKALSELNDITAGIADNREKAIKIKNDVIKKGGDKEVLKAELIKAFPDKDDLATVASYFKETDENSDTEFSLSDDEIREMIDSVGKTAIEEKTKKILQGVGGGKEVKPTTPTTTPTTTATTDTTPKTEEKKPTAEPTLSLNDDDFKAIEDFGKKVDKTLQEEYTPAHQFYSRIFSVPEWFPKGLDEFREAKKKYTNRPVYNKDTGKYEMGEGASPIAAKKELNMAKQVVDGLTKDVDRLEKAIPEEEENEKKEYEYVGWDNLPENRKNFFVNKFEDKIKSDEKYNEKFNSDLNNSVKYISGLQELVKDKKNNMTTKDDLFAYRDIKRTTRQGEPYVETNADKVLDAFIGDKFQNINDFLKKSPVDIENELKQIYASDLAKEDFEKDDYSETTERGASVNAKDVIEKQKETLDAIKNGDLKDANEKVDELKSAYEQSWKQQNTDMQEYSAAKRKLIKENAGNIARNVWFIIDLVTTMNRNAARLMPQGKYSPNLGNFETPALFQDYAAQLQNMRDAYNKVNTQAAEGRVSAEVGKALGATEALNNYMKKMTDVPYDKFKAYLDFTLYKQKNWASNDVQKDFAKYLRQLGLDYERHKFNQDLILAFQTGPKFLSNMNAEELDDWNKFCLAQAKDEDDASMAFLKKLALGIDKDKTLSAQEKAEKYADLFMSAIKSKAVRQGSDENTQIYLNQIDKIQRTIEAGEKAENLVMDIINDFMTGGVSHIIEKVVDANGNVITRETTKKGVR